MHPIASPLHLRTLNFTDRLLSALDSGLRTVFAPTRAARPSPAANVDAAASLSPEDTREAGALMRVNHVGEICAQALYQSQALFSRSEGLRRHFEQAAEEELDHLAWTADRIAELGTHTSHLAPLWWAGAFAWGSLAGLAGDKWSLGFVVETERQVEAHLLEDLECLPADDAKSRAIVQVMKDDEARHASNALAAGAEILPDPVPALVGFPSKVMKTGAYRL